MPTAPDKPCRDPRCPVLGPCPLHDPLLTYKRWYKTARWRRLRRQVLDDEPLCRHCRHEGRVEPATEVDHIIPHRGDEVLFWDARNLQPLCGAHHRAKTRRG